MINYGGGLIFPDSWAYGPPDPPEPACDECDGTGVIETFTGFPGDGPDRDYCPACKGTGGGQYNDCPECDGNGVAG